MGKRSKLAQRTSAQPCHGASPKAGSMGPWSVGKMARRLSALRV
jgi:hypothetical protein